MAGATGVVLTSNTEVGDTAIGGNSSIPGVRLAKSQVERLSAQIDSGELTLQLGENLRDSIRVPNGKLDQANTSTAWPARFARHSSRTLRHRARTFPPSRCW